jgi:serine/threonine protein kinase/TolB-like protein
LNPDRWRRVEDLFHEASERPAGERASFLAQTCAHDPDLRREVESLLQHAEEDFAEKSVQEAALNFSAAADLETGTQFAHYQIISMVGVGGMGRVYLAQDTRLKRKVALKMLNPEFVYDQRGLQRFQQEALSVSALNHPNLLTIYDVGESGGKHFIASEFIEGITLRQKLGAGKTNVNFAIDAAIQITSGLMAAHAAGVTHRDVKPENVMIRPDGLVKLLDFGIAKLSGRGRDTTHRKSRITIAGTVVGTARYMSPEQARGLDVDQRSDIFSLGAVLYEMITGTPAFPGDTASDQIAEILKTDPAPISAAVPGAPVEVERIVSKALAKDAGQRYQSASELLADLTAFKKEAEFREKLHATPPEGYPPGLLPRASANRWVALVALILLGAAASIWLWDRTRDAPGAGQPVRVAILPFRNLKPDPETAFLGFSLADAAITKLSYVNSIVVRPSSAVEKYRDHIADPQKVGSELNVNRLVTGSYLKDGDSLRVNTQLISLQPSKILWQDTFDVKYGNLLSVQDLVAQQIISGLELKLTPHEASNLKVDKPANEQAYEYYLRGVDFYSTNNFGSAIAMLEKAAAIDPEYALTWAHLGRAYTTNASLHFGGREDYGKAEPAYERAISLNPALIEPRVYMANLFTDTGRVEQAVPLLREALKTNANNAEAHWELGYAYRFAGALDESVTECTRARQLDPQVKINSSALNAYLYLGKYDEFLKSLPANNSVYILFYRGFGEYYKQDYAAAKASFEQAYRGDPTLLPAEVGRALELAMDRQNSQGLDLMRQTEQKVNERGVADAEGLYKVGQAYAVLGDDASAMRLIRRAIEGGFFPYPYLANDPLTARLRRDAAFPELMKQARQRYEQFRGMFLRQGT